MRLLLNYASFVFWGCVLGPWKLRVRLVDQKTRIDRLVCWLGDAAGSPAAGSSS